MRLNEKVVIYGTRVILVPYEKDHVEKYHNWMKDQEILEATASEPLSIEKGTFFYFAFFVVHEKIKIE